MLSVTTFTAVLNQLLPEPHAGLLNGILFGTKATIPKDFMDALIVTGTLHIVALSGMNITILESIIGTTLLPWVGRRVASALTILLIVGFIWFVGLSPSVIRAGIMGSMALIATIFGRQKWSIFFFTVTCVVMLAIHPAWIGDLSFQLSALATLGIILFGGKSPVTGPAARVLPSDVLANPSPRLSKSSDHINTSWQVFKLGWQRLRALDGSPSSRVTRGFVFIYSFVSDNLRLTLAAQTFTIPLILFTFRRISLVSPLTNVLIGWIIQPLTGLGLIVAILGWIWLPLGQVVAWFVWLCLEYLIFMISWTAKLPFSSVAW